MIRICTYFVAIILAVCSTAAGDWIMVDPGVRDTIEIGCPEFSTQNDSIIMSVPISIWADETLTGLMVHLIPGMANTTFRFVHWQDALPEMPLAASDFYRIYSNDSHEEYTSSVIIGAGDEELISHIVGQSTDETTLLGNMVFYMPESGLDSPAMLSSRAASPVPAVGVLHFGGRRSVIPVFINCDTVYHCLISEEIIGRFSAEPDSGYAPLTVQFKDATLNKPSGWIPAWEFGDGDSVTAVDPIHTYARPGRYYPVVHYPGDDSSGLGIIRPIEVLDSTARR